MKPLAGAALSASIAFSGAFLIRGLNAGEIVADEYKNKITSIVSDKIIDKDVMDRMIICGDFYNKYFIRTTGKMVIDCAILSENNPVNDLETSLNFAFRKLISCHNFYTKYSEILQLNNIEEIKTQSLECYFSMEFFNPEEIEEILEVAYGLNQ